MSDDPPRNAAGASRGPVGGTDSTTLSPVYETRQLKIAYGIQFHKGETLDVTPQDFLDQHLQLSADLEKVSDNEYLNHLQGVRYVIEETTSKQQFITWLQTPEIHLIYMGHARYGRGTCFGAKGLNDARDAVVLTEDWEEGSDADSGLFRLGYPFIGLEVSELVSHGYTANPVKESEGKPTAADCDPDVRAHLSSLKARAPDEISLGIAAQFRDPQDGDRYWSYHGSRGMSIVHHSGWQNTFSAPNDFGSLHDPASPDSTQVQCRVFTHLGCSTFLHNYPVVRQIANWRHADNERYAYWTTAVSSPPHPLGPWVHGLIAYNKWNAFASWAPSLAWAVQRANRTIRGKGGNYGLI
jgi:hypothetical protein